MSPIVTAGALLAAVVGAIEWRRPDRANRPGRVALVLLVAAALTGLARGDGREQPPGSAAPTGRFIALDAPDAVTLGDAVAVHGRLSLGAAGPARVVLSDIAGPVDSAVVTSAAPAFVLGGRPRAAGAALYRVTARGPGIDVTDSVGIAVEPARPPAVLVLDGSPSFETAYLKRWLAGRGARLLLRTTLTRDRGRVERVNEPATGSRVIQPATLGRYDLVLADAAALAGLTPAEQRALRAAVEVDGLGLLLTAGQPDGLNLPLLAGLTVTGAGELDRRVGRPAWRGMPRRSRVGIELAAGTLAQRAGTEPLVLDEAGGWLAARRPAGNGAVAVTLVRAPSRWQLEGADDLFAAYWSLLLAAVARDTATGVRVEGSAPRADRRLDLTLLSAGRPVAAFAAPDGRAEPLALAQDPFDPRRWSAAVWPRAAGWHAVRLADRTIPVLVHPAEKGPRPAGAPARPAVSDVWLFLLGLGALTGLWVESRRRRR